MGTIALWSRMRITDALFKSINKAVVYLCYIRTKLFSYQMCNYLLVSISSYYTLVKALIVDYKLILA